MKSPEDKTPTYAIAVIVVCIVVFYIIGAITSRMAYM
jgi:hypothetical protein